MKLEIATKWEQRDEELAADLFSVGYPAVSQERALERASVQRTLVLAADGQNSVRTGLAVSFSAA